MKTLLVGAVLLLAAGCGGSSSGGEQAAPKTEPTLTAAPLSDGATCIRATEDGQLTDILNYLTAAFGKGSPTAAQTNKADKAVSSLEALEPRAALDMRPDLHTLTTEVRKVMDVYAKGTGDIDSTKLKPAASNLAATCDVAAGN